jgi:tRNA threonylcarbamoyladenosine biosynthesis protein TsaE
MDIIFNLDEINSAAKKLLTAAGEKKLIALHGEMGAGKTTLVHALCNIINVKDIISSPTFSIINQYSTEKGDTVYHIDLYRLNGEQEALHAGIEDCLYSGSYCFVEWPEKIPSIFPTETLHVSIETIGNNLRKLQINL